jgi:hypothetical protein
LRNTALFDLLLDKRRLYKRVFDTPDGKRVLADIARFCSASSSPHVDGDAYGTHVLIGRLEVYLRLRQGLEITDAEIRQHAEQPEEE